MPGKLIETYQVRVYMNARELGLTQAEAAYVAQFSERSGQRIESGDYQPNRGKVRAWRTSADPLAEVWESELEPMLRAQPKLKPMTLFEYLQTKYPGKYPQVLRTLQRRVATWKALHGSAPEVMFELRHEPGRLGFSDFTELKGIEITLNGQPFEHLIYHYRLGYSGWQYAQIIQGGESFIALSEGLQNALFACGGAPKQHRTDSLSAAYRNLGGVRNKPLTRLYDDLCHHYRMQPTRNNTSIAHENGSIESPHGHLKNRIEQALLLRGSYEFSSIAEYQALINQAVDRLNAQHTEKIEAEKAYLQPLPQGRVADYEILTARVSCHSTIDVRCVLYTVPARLIGRQLELHLYHDRIVGYLHRQQVVELPRIRTSGTGKRRARCINYRHVAEGLRRKPRAFLYCTWQQDLLPNEQWQHLWQQMKTQFDLDTAAVLMVESLYIAAADDKESQVAEY
ncbi:IS21 family transposase (plasmid) [Kovacikia minuta CCNUW1]|uniref:IS21 family transposase n=2 Tax=Kovacikia minuta TaxID=2931930 RepID=UPI001CCF4836|nr:IS21 family transposase [Kovacikia minuta CCNUW1]UBF25677.1 IS21 family transposase [Kovacikia minuta CCNUW1]UBF27994.1 IS21 family transposase [Kovacikia minuta CCNUW1]UBF28252.1 IS21 family transposase [Kovacikia minuta CCNUW1]UBF30236.1 IS21 family transposase [Kovacikia minuta CCNUW1]